MIPPLLLMFGLGYLFRFLSYLQRRWLWGAVLLLCCMGLASLFEDKPAVAQALAEHTQRPEHNSWRQNLQEALNAPLGGFIGQFLNDYVLHYVGKVGATIVLGALYLISLIYLTNFQLGEWCRQWWAVRFGGQPLPKTANDNELERRARELEKQARKFQEQLDKSTKGAVPKVARTQPAWAPTCGPCPSRPCAT